jgi:hypothetical protein
VNVTTSVRTAVVMTAITTNTHKFADDSQDILCSKCVCAIMVAVCCRYDGSYYSSSQQHHYKLYSSARVLATAIATAAAIAAAATAYALLKCALAAVCLCVCEL